MIKIKDKLFHLHNNNISYYIYCNSHGHLETIYFGEYLEDIGNIDAIRKADIDNDTTQYFDFSKNKEFTYPDHYRYSIESVEISTHGLRDKRGAPIILKKEDGTNVTDFRFVSYEILESLPTYEELPYARKNSSPCQTLRILLKDYLSDIYVYENISIFEDKDIIIKNFEIVNKGNIIVPILRANSMQLDLKDNQYKLHHFAGKWASERFEVVTDIKDGIQEVSSNTGRSSHEENPFVFLTKKDTSYDKGEVIGFNLIYSGNFSFRTFNNSFCNTHITYGINDEDFNWMLKPNEVFVTPQAVISYSQDGIDGMSINMHKFVKENIVNPLLDQKEKPILFNSWEGCYFDFTTESIISYIDDSLKIGSELFVLDDGWFGKRDNDESGLGDWFVNENKINLKKVVDHCTSKGMNFGIWFEPEMINPDSNLYREHPEYILTCKGMDQVSLYRHQLVLDFSSEEVVENIYQQMIKIIDSYDISYIKWDHNRMINEHFSFHHNKENQGEIYHRVILGYYTLIKKLTQRYPDILFEGCASGGGRFDLGTLFYYPQIWASDDTDPIQRMYIQYNTSLGYPLSTIGSHASANPITSYKTKALLALFGTYGYEMNPNKLNEKEISELSEVASIYKKYHHEVIANGTLYHLSSPQDSNAMSMCSVSKDKSKALVIYMNLLKEYKKTRFLKLRGLEKNKKYRNSFDNNIFTGDYYEKVGINLSRQYLPEFECQLFILEEVE